MNYFVIQAVQAICEKLLTGGEFAMLGTKPSAAVVKNETMYFSVIVVLSDIDIITVTRLRSSLFWQTDLIICLFTAQQEYTIDFRNDKTKCKRCARSPTTSACLI